MKTSDYRWVLARGLVIAGSIAMLVGAADPLEGSVVILAGCTLVTLGTFLGKAERSLAWYWLLIFSLIAAGVGAMFVLSALGGIGGGSGRSGWWGVLILPYPIAWVMGMVSLVFRMIGSRRRKAGTAVHGNSSGL